MKKIFFFSLLFFSCKFLSLDNFVIINYEIFSLIEQK